MQAVSRIFIGMISGIMVVSLNKSNIAFGIYGTDLHATFLFGVAAGFSERFIPDVLLRLTKEQQISEND